MKKAENLTRGNHGLILLNPGFSCRWLASCSTVLRSMSRITGKGLMISMLGILQHFIDILMRGSWVNPLIERVESITWPMLRVT